VAEGVDARAVLAEGRISALVLTEAQPFADQMSAGLTVPALSANPETALFLYESCPPSQAKPPIGAPPSPPICRPGNWRPPQVPRSAPR
jgi:hypothetical protein